MKFLGRGAITISTLASSNELELERAFKREGKNLFPILIFRGNAQAAAWLDVRQHVARHASTTAAVIRINSTRLSINTVLLQRGATQVLT